MIKLSNDDIRKVVEYIEPTLKKWPVDYLLNFNDDKYSIINIVDNEELIDWKKDGWNIWITKHIKDEEDKSFWGDICQFIQIANGSFGCDTHILTEDEMYNLLTWLVSQVNHIKNN